jgi:hypothetical protein
MWLISSNIVFLQYVLFPLGRKVRRDDRELPLDLLCRDNPSDSIGDSIVAFLHDKEQGEIQWGAATETDGPAVSVMHYAIFYNANRRHGP